MMSSSWTDHSAEITSQESSEPSEALNFLEVLTSTPLPTWTSGSLSLYPTDYFKLPRSAGSGGFATVQVAQKADDGRLVAVKRSHASISFDRDFAKLTLELRILAHERLRPHRHILDILALCLDGSTELIFLGLVLEYSSLGHLANFLDKRRKEHGGFPVSETTKLVSQVSCGLAALHEELICHGDIKTQNVLVFSEHGTFIAKVSDFGSAVIPESPNSQARVACPVGTPLLSAPEISGMRFTKLTLPDIHAAIRTDVYSFGLLLWEALKNGDSYFDVGWMEGGGRTQDDDREGFLQAMPAEGLLSRSKEFLLHVEMDSELRMRVESVFDKCLRNDPFERGSMSELNQLLCPGTGIRQVQTQDEISQSSPRNHGLVSWTTNNSFFELLENNQDTATNINRRIDRYPLSIQRHVLEALKMLAISATSTTMRAHAAMCTAECYTLAYGCSYDCTEILHWLQRAASEGLEHARLWYDRVQETIGQAKCGDLALAETDSDIAYLGGQTSTYLVNRIHRLHADKIDGVRMALTLIQLEVLENSKMHLSIFNNLEDDYPPYLHVAALLGEDSKVIELLQTTSISMLSPNGFSALHYACIGGRLSTLKLLLHNGADASACAVYSITPLHLCIFFPQDSLPDAVALLIDSGAMMTTESTLVYFSAHDILLVGDPLAWAVLTRNLVLTNILARYAINPSKMYGIKLALLRFFVEIAESLLSVTDISENLDPPQTYSVRRPFNHWISHGQQSRSDIQATIQLALKYGLLDCDNAIRRAIASARTQDSLQVVEALLESCPRQSLTRVYNRSKSVVTYAIDRSTHNSAWRGLLGSIVARLSTSDLDEHVIDGGVFNYLHVAVAVGAVVAANVLIKAGADVNVRARDDAELTPLHICARRGSPVEMWSLLLEHGADLSARDRLAKIMPLQVAIMERRSQPMQHDLLQLILRYANDYVCSDTLHGLLRVFVRFERESIDNCFRWVLCQQRLVKHVNSTNDNGVTMLHRATSYLCHTAVKYLLSAGADASIPLISNGVPILPLQVVCFRGRFIREWARSEDSGIQLEVENMEPQLQKLLDETIKIAMELLEWHTEQGDRSFEGITKIHLIYQMRAVEQQERLGIPYSSSTNILGAWPSLAHKVTPEELQIATDDYETKAIEDCLSIIAAR
ncbi:hypothetical protein F5B19DRAFT_33284 [Rostrohypoxylon terebratum]|nr:hypothetical protein F5B19DRAFT_33284 [Rostrohypoxylon terebratum]